MVKTVGIVLAMSADMRAAALGLWGGVGEFLGLQRACESSGFNAMDGLVQEQAGESSVKATLTPSEQRSKRRGQGRERDHRRWLPRSCLMLILLLAAGLRLWNIADHGFGNIYYAAAVRSMAGSWHNFLYASFDPSGFLMLDKPPFAFWVQATCVKLFGFNGLSLHLPQVIEGVAAVLLVCVLTRRVADTWAALIAALVMAVTPACVAADRSNLPDSCLLLVLLLATWTLLQASSTGSGRRLAVSMVLVGVAFGVKMIAAFVALPVFYLTYWVGAPLDWKRRVGHLCAATLIVFGVSLSWPLLVDLTPACARPYVGDTRNNSALNLAFGMFGFDRFTGRSQPPPSHAEDTRPARSRRGHGEDRLTAQGGRPGPFRLANRDMAGHITWLMPLAVVGFAAVVRVPRPRSCISPLQQTVLLWGGWFVMYTSVYSFSNSPVHPYYLNMLAPPVAAMVGIGVVALWRASRHEWRALTVLILGIALTAAWQARVLTHHSDWQRWTLPIVLTGSAVSVLLLLAARVAGNHSVFGERLGHVAVTLGLATLLAFPAVWSATPALAPGGRMVPIADPVLLRQTADPEVEAENRAAIRRLVEFLEHERQDERYVLAVPDIHLAAPIIIETGAPVMAYGGFTGHDPILTCDQFAAMVEAGAVRFVMLNDGPSMGMMGQGFDDLIGAWVRRHGTEVEPNARKLASESGDESGRPITLPGPAAVHRFIRLMLTPPRRIAPWGPTAEMIQGTFRSPTVRIYDCRLSIPNIRTRCPQKSFELTPSAPWLSSPSRDYGVCRV